MTVCRIWRHSPGWVLAGHVLLDVLLLLYTRTAGAAMMLLSSAVRRQMALSDVQVAK
jgi:hypothetical protein